MYTLIFYHFAYMYVIFVNVKLIKFKKVIIINMLFQNVKKKDFDMTYLIDMVVISVYFSCLNL